MNLSASEMASRRDRDREIGFPEGNADERELLLGWLNYLRGAVLRKIDGLSDEQARWQPEGNLISLLGIVNHLTHVEWRWIDGGMRGESVHRSEEEFQPGARERPRPAPHQQTPGCSPGAARHSSK